LAATVTTIGSATTPASTGALLRDFLSDLTNANRPANTIRATTTSATTTMLDATCRLNQSWHHHDQ
jgi:hypothetical protein